MGRVKLRSKACLGHPSNCSLPGFQPPRMRRLPLAGLSRAKTAATSSLAPHMTPRPSNPESLALQRGVRSPRLPAYRACLPIPRYVAILSEANESPDNTFSLRNPPALLWAFSLRLPIPASFLRDLVRRPPISILEEGFGGRLVLKKEVELQRRWVRRGGVIHQQRCREARCLRERGASC